MDHSSFFSDINELPVFDTHTHLNIPGVPICAESVWDIAHYFWFLRELQAAGYPTNALDLDEDTRYTALASAFKATRNTSWNWAVRGMARTLYKIELGSEDSFREFNSAIVSSSHDTGWAQTVIDAAQVKRITVNIDDDVDLPGLEGVGCLLTVKPCSDIESVLESIKTQNLTATKLNEALDTTVSSLESTISDYSRRGVRGIRVDNSPFEHPDFHDYDQYLERPEHADIGEVQGCRRYLYDQLFRIAETKGMLVQMFLGMKRFNIPVDTALNDTGRIVRLHPLFHRHPGITFELVMGCELNNLDVVQAARMYRNVNAGGLWWFNFRTSTYNQTLHYRFEALPATRSAIIATDARCIEWCFTKTMLVKKVLAEFLIDRIEKGWIDRADSLDVARNWLHDTAKQHYI